MNQVPGTLKHFSKDESAAAIPTALNLIKSISPHSIEYTGISNEVRGLFVLGGTFATFVGIGTGQMMLSSLLQDGLDDYFYRALFGIIAFFMALSVYCLLRAIRVEFFCPEDEPVVFDRKHRKVYRIFREVRPGVTGLFKRWPLRATSYHWDQIEGTHNATLITTGSTLARYHHLTLLVRGSGVDQPIIDHFEIGNGIQLGELSVAPVWEHIRRFMNEDGPHVPPGESIIATSKPQSLWESMGAVGPIGPGYVTQWKNHMAMMCFYHALFPFFLPMSLMWGVFNWLSFKTATPITWPNELVDTIGDDCAA